MSGARTAAHGIAAVARALGADLLGKVVFVGGCAAALFEHDGVPLEIRVTDDVDVIVEMHSVTAYASLTAELRVRGFREDDREGAPRCRFRLGKLIVDVMPTDAQVLGYSNRWFSEALRTADEHEVEGIRLRALRPVFFVATKLVAFADRGSGDFFASHDLEDVVTVLDALPSLRTEIATGTADVHRYARTTLSGHLRSESFRDSILGHLAGNDDRAAALLAWIGTLPLETE